MRDVEYPRKTIGSAILAALAALSVVTGILWIAVTLVADADERQLYRIGTVVDAEVITEEIYTARTFENMYNFDGFSDLAVVRDWTTTPSTRRARYRYQLAADGLRFTLRNVPGTRRFRTGTTVAITYDPEDVARFRLYTGGPRLNLGFLLSGIVILAAGTVGVFLLRKNNLW